MTESSNYRHGLEQLLQSLPQGHNGDLTVTINTGSAYFNLRGKSEQPEFTNGVMQATGLELPLKPNTFVGSNHRIFWQGPDEWLIEAAQQQADELQSGLSKALAGMHQSVTDISGGISSLTLSGEGARALMAKGCTMDLDANKFLPGDCAQTGLGKINVLIARGIEAEQFDLIVCRTYGEYLLLWLNHAGREFEIRFQQN